VLALIHGAFSTPWYSRETQLRRRVNGLNNMLAKVLQLIVAVSWVALGGCGGASANPRDPVRVVDEKSRRAMTERDVVAVANIHHFSVTQSKPHHHELSRRQIEDLTSSLKQGFAETGHMPRFYGEAAEYWFDLQRNWSQLSAQQQRRTREYAASMLRLDPSSQQSALASGTTSQAANRNSARRQSTHDHDSCDCEHRSSHNHGHAHDHDHAHSGSGHEHRRSSGQSSRRDPASVTAEVLNFPLMSDAIFPP
jgi:hypothetical protein